MMGKLKIITLLVTVLLFSIGAQADIIYHNSEPNRTLAWTSDFDVPIQAADNFSLNPGKSVITDIHWWGIYWTDTTPSGPDNFTIRLYNNVVGANLPEVNPFYDVTVGAVNRETDGLWGGFDLYYYWLDVSPINLAPDTEYWLSIVNNTAGDDNYDWYWAAAIDVGSHAFRFNDGVGWEPDVSELAFYLTDDAVPEPATLLLLGSGLVGLGVFRKRFRKKYPI